MHVNLEILIANKKLSLHSVCIASNLSIEDRKIGPTKTHTDPHNGDLKI